MPVTPTCSTGLMSEVIDSPAIGIIARMRISRPKRSCSTWATDLTRSTCAFGPEIWTIPTACRLPTPPETIGTTLVVVAAFGSRLINLLNSLLMSFP